MENGPSFHLYRHPPSTTPKKRQNGTFHSQFVPTCSNCLSRGHHVSACSAPVKCRNCLADGHKAGDTQCNLVPPRNSTEVEEVEQTSAAAPVNLEISNIASQSREEESPSPPSANHRGATRDAVAPTPQHRESGAADPLCRYKIHRACQREKMHAWQQPAKIQPNPAFQILTPV